MIREFRKKPVVIKAIQFTGANHDEIGHFCGLKAKLSGREGSLNIHTLEGVMTADPGDWIIQGVKFEYYPCKPDIFEATYEAVVPDLTLNVMDFRDPEEERRFLESLRG